MAAGLAMDPFDLCVFAPREFGGSRTRIGTAGDLDR